MRLCAGVFWLCYYPISDVSIEADPSTKVIRGSTIYVGPTRLSKPNMWSPRFYP